MRLLSVGAQPCPGASAAPAQQQESARARKQPEVHEVSQQVMNTTEYDEYNGVVVVVVVVVVDHYYYYFYHHPSR